MSRFRAAFLVRISGRNVPSDFDPPHDSGKCLISKASFFSMTVIPNTLENAVKSIPA